MIRWFKYRRRVAELQKLRARTQAAFRVDITRALRERNTDAYESLKHWRSVELGMLDSEIESLKTGRLIAHAERLMLPTPAVNHPDEDGPWDFEMHTGMRYLTREAMVILRRQIREEIHERRQTVSFWITGLVGVIGALTGLLSVLLR